MATPVKLKNCATCEAWFVPASNRQKYCRSCGRRGKATCEVCGTRFDRHPTSSGRWCSAECAGLGRRRPDMLPKPCEQCGEEYKPIRRNQRFCSQECSGIALRRPDQTCPVCSRVYNDKHYAGTCSRACAGVLRRKEPEGRDCERCGARIPWPQSQNHRFCSRECRKTPIGTLSPTDTGYLMVMTANGWKLEHRQVMEQQVGRPLETWERVHHKNGIRHDNRPGNLELWKVKSHAAKFPKDPPGVRASDYHCPGCRCGELTT